MASPSEILEIARTLVGRETPPEVQPPVTFAQIQRYCYAVDDLNPLYLIEEVAARGPHGGIVAPPLFSGAPSFKPTPLSQLRADGLPASEADPFRLPIRGARTRLTGVEVDFRQFIRVGDVLTRISRVADVFQKQGRSGPLIFSVRETRVLNQRAELVCVERNTTAAVPQGEAAQRILPPDPTRATPPTGESAPFPGPNARYWNDVQEGDALPDMVRTVTPVQAVLYGALKANSHLIHYDRDYAHREGLGERVAQGDLLGDLLCQLAVRWMGQAGRLRRFSYEVRAPGFLGEDITQRGRVARRWREGNDGLVTLELWSETPGGRRCLHGSATVALP